MKQQPNKHQRAGAWALVGTAVAAGILMSAPPAQAAATKPNILVIFGDDIGQANISAYTRGLVGYRTPNIDRLAKEGMVYQPMLELLAYLRANGFRTYMVTGGGIEFMRPWSEKVYGNPPEQVIGSSIKTKFEVREGQPVLVRLPEMNFVDDGPGKPVGIQMHIGRRPVAAFGNSDGDLQMMQWTAAGGGPRFCLYVHHNDAEREWAYDRTSSIGRLDKGLEEARAKGWTVVSMKDDWKSIFPVENR